jgi:hypothetical protein
MRVQYIQSSSMRGRRHPIPCWSYPEMTPRTLLVLPKDDLLPKGVPCKLQSRRTLVDQPKPISSGLSAIFRQVVTSGLSAVFHRGVTSGLKAVFHPMQEGQPEPGKRDQTLQKTQNSDPVHQEWEARPSTVLHTLPREGWGRRTPPGRDRGKPSGGGWPRRPESPTAGETR